MNERTVILEDALEHIMKVAGQAHRPTMRLDWISARAELAIKGIPYSEEKLPKYPKNRSGQRICEWLPDAIDGVYETSCGNAHVINNGTPSENGMKFCCYCGAYIEKP